MAGMTRREVDWYKEYLKKLTDAGLTTELLNVRYHALTTPDEYQKEVALQKTELAEQEIDRRTSLPASGDGETQA